MQQKLNNELLTQFITDMYSSNQVKDIDFKTGITVFLNYVQSAKSYDTLKYYKSSLKYIIDFLEKRKVTSFAKITPNVILEYINFCNVKGLKNATINKRITALKTMSKYLFKIKIIDHVDFAIEKLPEEDPMIKTVDNNNLKKILIYLETQPIFHKLMFLILLSTGTRRKELVHIKIKNINLNDNTIYLEQTKSRKGRLVFFDNNTKLIIQEIITNNKNKYLFTNPDGTQVTVDAVSGVFRRMKEKLNLEVLSPHKLRHTFGTSIVEHTGDIETACRLLGHSSYEMTKKYLHLKDEHLKAKSLAFNPLNILDIKKT